MKDRTLLHRICLPRGISSLCCNSTSQMWLQSSDLSPTVWGEPENQEFLQGMDEWKVLLVLPAGPQ